MRGKLASPVGIGVISLITILLVLVLSVFSCLTLSTAQADYALARRGADTVTNYYNADGEAHRLCVAFMDGQDPELEMIVPMDRMQGLYIHLLRNIDGTVMVSEWRTVLLGDFSAEADRSIPVWNDKD